MAKVQIKTLTYVHVGSGNFLQNNMDFVQYKDKNNVNRIGVVDEYKLMNLLTEQHLQSWISCIDKKEDTKELVKRYAPKAKIGDYTKRRVQNYSTPLNPNMTLKEQIHDGMGKAYIPGSSIKGAIRSCVLASMANLRSENDIKNDRGNLTAKSLEGKLFGNDPKCDVFRFLKVGDFFFENSEAVIRLVNLNIRQKHDLYDDSKAQYVEVIDKDMCSSSNIKLDINLNEYASGISNDIKKLPLCMSSLQVLFKTINEHTMQLLAEEINIFQTDEYIDDNDNCKDDYIEEIKGVLSIVKGCKENECVLRLGHASGWRFITGAFSEQLNNFDDVVPYKARPRNSDYTAFRFPKTRRVDEDIYLLGFVKLTLV